MAYLKQRGKTLLKGNRKDKKEQANRKFHIINQGKQERHLQRSSVFQGNQKTLDLISDIVCTSLKCRCTPIKNIDTDYKMMR